MHRLPVPSVAVPGHVTCPPYYPHPALEAPRSKVASSGQQSPSLSFHVAVSLPGYRLSIGAEADTALGSQVCLLPPERDVAAIISKKNSSLGCVGSRLGWAEPEPLAPVLTRFAPCPRVPLWHLTPSLVTLPLSPHRPAFSPTFTLLTSFLRGCCRRVGY